MPVRKSSEILESRFTGFPPGLFAYLLVRYIPSGYFPNLAIPKRIYDNMN